MPPQSLEKKRYISGMAPRENLWAVYARDGARRRVYLAAGVVLLLGVTVSDPTSRRRGEHSERVAHHPHAYFAASGSGKLFS